MTPFIPGGPARFDHQRRGLQLLIQTKGVGALLFDPGLGKTATVIDYACLLALKAAPNANGVREARVLVLCPLVAVDTWVLQSETFMSPQVNWWAEAVGGTVPQRAEALASRGGQPYARPVAQPRGRRRPAGMPTRSAHVHRAWAVMGRRNGQPIDPASGPDGLGVEKPRVVLEVVNLDTLSSRAKHNSGTMADLVLNAVQRFGPELVVIDESHRIKGATSNVSRLAARMVRLARRRVILTGTVMPHSPLDVFGQWRFLAPTDFGDLQLDGTRRSATYGGFKDRYAVLGGWMGQQVVGFRNLDEMQTIMAARSCVARKEEALDLPPTTSVTIPVELSPAEVKAYRELKDDLATTLAPGAVTVVPNRLAQMMRLRQVTAGHLPDAAGSVHVIGRSKVNTIRSLVQDTLAGETRVVVFGVFTVEIAMLEKALTEKGTEVLTITGETSMEDRALIRKRFGSDDPARLVLVAQVRTLSLAVNELVTASHAVFASLSQRRDDYEQALARLNRQGQTRPVTFWHAIAPGTVDDVILRTHHERGDLETAMLAHIRGDD